MKVVENKVWQSNWDTSAPVLCWWCEYTGI
jgi:hypothetical protein